MQFQCTSPTHTHTQLPGLKAIVVPTAHRRGEERARAILAEAADGSISHFSHPGHELVKRHYTGPSILCDICWEHLSGLAYGCRAGCNFVIHDACAGHPQTLSSPAHHPHQLVLVQTRRDAAPHGCGVCAGRCAAGCFLYRCPPCGFDMHPRCTNLPLAVRSARHHPTAHDLALVAGEGRCAACHHGGRAWYYRCMVCSGLDLHVSCAAGEKKDAGGRHGGNGRAPGAGTNGTGEKELVVNVTRDALPATLDMLAAAAVAPSPSALLSLAGGGARDVKKKTMPMSAGVV